MTQSQSSMWMIFMNCLLVGGSAIARAVASHAATVCRRIVLMQQQNGAKQVGECVWLNGSVSGAYVPGLVYGACGAIELGGGAFASGGRASHRDTEQTMPNRLAP